MSNILQDYPNHKAFDELLNSCGSMTHQLENMGHKLSVELISDGNIYNNFCRYTILKLNATPVILALSYSNLVNHEFISILRNANNTPIGKFLFANNSKIIRNKISIHKKNINELTDELLSNYLKKHYHNKQEIFSRESEFISANNEQMMLIEIILPEFKKFFK